MIPVTIPVELEVPSLGHRESMITLLDLGCTGCLVSPNTVARLGIRLRELKVPVAFCQLDGSITEGAQMTFVTEPVEMKMGSHKETLSFIVVPGMDRPIVVGLAWLLK